MKRKDHWAKLENIKIPARQGRGAELLPSGFAVVAVGPGFCYLRGLI